MWDFASRWCQELRQLVRATRGDFDVDLSRYAFVMTPGEYAELCQDGRALRFALTPLGGTMTLYGVRIVVVGD
jgi:hypothetical protein